MIHELKSWTHFFDAIAEGRKLHDLRRIEADRQFKVGDVLLLRRYCPVMGKYTGEQLAVQVSFITSEDTPCAYSSGALARGFAILSIKLVTADGFVNGVPVTSPK